MIYDARYYQNGNYSDYLFREDKYKLLGSDLNPYLQQLDIQSVLDFGCAVGFLVKSLKTLGFYAIGYDVSKWAVEYGKKILKIDCLTTDPAILFKKFDCTMALDVLEHMTLDQIISFLEKSNSQYLITRIPVALKNESKFHLDISNNDPSHITCLDKTSWTEIFLKTHWHLKETLNLPTLWDSNGVLAACYKRT